MEKRGRPAPPGASLQVGLVRGSPDERRYVTILFADLVGSTSLAGRLDPEDLRVLLGSFLTALAAEVARYDGTLDKYVGDAVMAVFGAPRSHEDDATRALYSALSMQRAVARLNESATAGARLELRIGVNSGEVVSGVLDAEAQAAYTVVGEAVNLAQRLQAAAQPGEILVSGSTHRQTHDFAFEGARQIAVKGRAEPMTVYRLTGVRADLVHRPIPTTGLVGRTVELGAVRDAIIEVEAGRGSLTLIVGEPGVGKSRLVAESKAAHRGPIRWLEGRAVSIGRTLSYLPFLEMIRGDAGITDDDDEATSWSKLHARVDALFGTDTPDVLPYVAKLLALEVPGDLGQRLRNLEADAVRRQIFLVSRRYFAALARETPTVVVFEDLHWADDSSAELLEHLVPLVAQLPLGICVTTRPDAADRLARLRTIASEQKVARIIECPLAPLGSEESERLVAGLLGVGRVPEDVRGVVLSKAEGNPFFIEEVVRALLDLKVIVRDPNGWTMTRPLDEIDIPDSIQGIIRARIDRLDDELKHVLRVAAVVGRTFLYRVLREVAKVESALDSDLSVLKDLEIIIERARAPELEYAFRHVLIQESTYESILVRHRRELHLAVARAIEQLFTQRLEEFYGFLAYHYARAEDWPRAQGYLFRAADQASRLAADAEALLLYDEAVAAYGRAFGDRWERVERGALEAKIGEALFRRGEHRAAATHLHQALAHFGQPFPSTKAGVRASIAGELARQVFHRAWSGRLPLPGTAPADHLIEERLHAYEVLGWIDYYIDNERLLLDSMRLLNESEKRGWSLGVVIGSLGMGIVADFIPVFGVAERYHRRGVALAERTQEPIELGYAQMGLGYHQQRTGQWIEALDHWGKGAVNFRRAGDLAKWGAATWGTTWLAHRTGQLDRSRSQSEELIHVGQDTADRQLHGWGLYFLGRWTWQRGEVEAGVRHLEEAIACFRAVPDLPNLAGASGDLGICRLRQSRWDDAVEVLEQTARLMREQNVRGFLAHVHNALAEAYLLKAEQSDGAARDRALDKAAKALRLAARRSKVEREGFVGVMRLLGTHQWLTGQHRRARVSWEQSAQRATALGARYDLASVRLEVGRRTRDAIQLNEAAAIFSDLGAQADLSQARALLGGL